MRAKVTDYLTKVVLIGIYTFLFQLILVFTVTKGSVITKYFVTTYLLTHFKYILYVV